MIYKFPKDFLWGTATAAHQIEGNNKNSDWWLWEQSRKYPPHINPLLTENEMADLIKSAVLRKKAKWNCL